MFGLFKPKLAPLGPHTFTINAEIAADAADVYALLDFADPRNAYRARGADVRPTGEGGFVMTLPAMPDLAFHIDLIEAQAPNHYAFAIAIDPLVGRLASGVESYTVWNVPEGGCRLRLENAATFQEGTRLKHVPEEVTMLTMASYKSVAKLKLQAEQGVDAVIALENSACG